MVELPNVNQLFVDPNTGLINRTWYLALLGLNNQIPANVVVSVNVAGNNGIQATGGPITSSGVISLFLGNITCANVQVAGTVTAANAVIAGAVASANITTGGIQATGTVTSANERTTGIIATGTVTAANAIVTGSVTSGNVALSGVLRLGNAFVAGVVVPTGTLVVVDSTGTAYRIPCLV